MFNILSKSMAENGVESDEILFWMRWKCLKVLYNALSLSLSNV